ncbi:hypothetical protein [Paracoccus jeotgali]|uniref:hypothetical protein n=1 Tax=Paracoccus jeotgali TaxID=2065379 RepID=UPI00131596DA|nr:hypothetical protein [Paracoccus jeotgali]
MDDLTISGPQISGEFRSDVRSIVAQSGLRSHKLRSQTGNRPVFITGVGVVGANLIVPNRIELRSKELWAEFLASQTFEEVDSSATRLLSHLGGIKAIVGSSTTRGQKLSSEMNSIRQKREKARRLHEAEVAEQRSQSTQSSRTLDGATEIEQEEIPF